MSTGSSSGCRFILSCCELGCVLYFLNFELINIKLLQFCSILIFLVKVKLGCKSTVLGVYLMLL